MSKDMGALTGSREPGLASRPGPSGFDPARLQGFVTGAANQAASEWPWVANSLHESIANLGYPVGMGMSPHPESTERAAKMICEYIACQIDASTTEARDLLASTILLYSEANRHVVELSFGERCEAERTFDWLEKAASGMSAGTAETPQAAQGEARQPDGEAETHKGGES